MATAHSPAKTHITPARLIAFWVTGNTSIRAKLASQSTAAAMAAAWPRTAVGNTSPCSVQPTPPTPMANEAMKKSSPIMMTASRQLPAGTTTRPHAATRAKTIMPVKPPMASALRPNLSIQRKPRYVAATLTAVMIAVTSTPATVVCTRVACVPEKIGPSRCGP
jgi:hypothetical protein